MSADQIEQSHEDSQRVTRKEELKAGMSFQLANRLPSGEIRYQVVTVVRKPYPASEDHPKLGDLVDLGIENPTQQTIVLPLAALGVRQKPSSRAKMVMTAPETNWWLEPYVKPKSS